MLPRAYVRAGDRAARREAAVRTPGATPAPPRAPPPPRSLRTVVVSHATTAVREARCVPKAWGSPATRCTARPAPGKGKRVQFGLLKGFLTIIFQ